MKFWKLITSMLLLFFIGEKRVFAETVYLLPEAFELQTTGGVPSFSVSIENGAPKARMVFVASYRSSMDALLRTYGENISSIEVIHLPLNPESFAFMAEFLNGPSLTVDSVHREFFSNQVLVEVRFRPVSWSVEQIRTILQTPLLFGFVDGEIACTRDTRHALCNRPLTGIPVSNQYRNDPFATEAERHLLVLNEIKNRLAIGEPIPLMDDLKVDDKARSVLFNDGKCRDELRDVFSEGCRLILQYSKNYSIVDSIRSAIRNAYPVSDEVFGEISRRIVSNSAIQISTVLSGDDDEIVKTTSGSDFVCRLRGSGRAECQGVLRYEDGEGVCRAIASWGAWTDVQGFGFGIIDIASRGGFFCGLHIGGDVSCLGESGADRSGDRVYIARNPVRFKSGFRDARRISLEPAWSDTSGRGYYDIEFDGVWDRRLFNEAVYDHVWLPREGSGPGEVVGCGH